MLTVRVAASAQALRRTIPEVSCKESARAARHVALRTETLRVERIGPDRPAQTGRRIPVIEEEFKVGKREVQRGGVRVFTRTTENVPTSRQDGRSGTRKP